MCPSSPAAPAGAAHAAARRRRSPPPIPVPSVSITASSRPRAAPQRCSASSAAFASLSTNTGSAEALGHQSRNGTPRSGRWTVLTRDAASRGRPATGCRSRPPATSGSAASSASRDRLDDRVEEPRPRRRHGRSGGPGGGRSGPRRPLRPAASCRPGRRRSRSRRPWRCHHTPLAMSGRRARQRAPEVHEVPRAPVAAAARAARAPATRGSAAARASPGRASLRAGAAARPRPRRKRTPHHHGPRRQVARARASSRWVGSELRPLPRQRADPAGQGRRRARASALAGGGPPIVSPTTILVLGSDQRAARTRRSPGRAPRGPSRSRLDPARCASAAARTAASRSPRDTVVDIPGHGRQKINAAYAIGGAPLAITDRRGSTSASTINHVIEVNFDDFPEPDRRDGRHQLQGRLRRREGQRRLQATAASRCASSAGEERTSTASRRSRSPRMRKNDCNPSENDLTARAPPAADHQRDEAAACSRRPLRPPAVDQLAGAEDVQDRHERPDARAVFAELAIGGTPETRVLGTVDGDVPEDRKQRSSSVPRRQQ